jgi:hypothetical protein
VTMPSSILIAMLLPAILELEHVPGRPFGDGGRSAGPYQISAGAVADVNGAFDADYSWPQDVLTERGGRAIASLYLSLLHDRFFASVGRQPTPRELAACYNGGLSRWKSPSAMDYGLRAAALMGCKP